MHQDEICAQGARACPGIGVGPPQAPGRKKKPEQSALATMEDGSHVQASSFSFLPKGQHFRSTPFVFAIRSLKSFAHAHAEASRSGLATRSCQQSAGLQ